MELVISLRDESMRVYDRQQPERFKVFREGVLSGAHSEFTILDSISRAEMIGVGFKVGGAYPFLPLPATELHNAIIPLEALWGAAARNLREQLLAAATPEDKFHILESFLLARLARSFEAHPAVSLALSAFQNESGDSAIATVTERIGYSPRHFIQLFSHEVGLTPKQFCRIQRFQKILHLLEGKQQVQWSDIALQCGYFDQAHFIHDFRAFSGLTPGAYLALRSQYRNHVPLSTTR
ncbi:AraC family transcriptional regulator [Ktedonosporobacter rubrisoli]|uniref:AraC family transcriptional regulator n=2 Tax=Ktedonosporobacter rubrisoli TaxID=2509675 RepID=A0A4P6K4X4_KTERU|nr:AraC family transcriptional regulator [Ktedonosporobacter rubrisoli]